MKKFLLILVSSIVALSLWASGEHTVYGTYYLPSYGSHTASGDRIVASKVKSGEHRWVALSRDMFSRYGYKMNDTIEVKSDRNPSVNGYWVVKDKMSGRKKIDFLMHRSNTRSFRNGDVTIRKANGDNITVEIDDEEIKEVSSKQ